MAGQPLGAAAERGDRALAHLVGGERGDERQPAAALFGGRPGRLGGAAPDVRRQVRRRRRGADAALLPLRPRAPDAGPAASGQASSASPSFLPPKRFLATSSALRLVSRRACGALPRRLARLGGLALGALDRVALLLDARFFLGDLALFGLAQPGIAERAGAGRCAPRRSACAAPRRTASARRGAGCGARRRRGGGSGRPAGWPRGCRRSRSWRAPRSALASPGDAALDLLDHDRLGAAVAEALAHDALLDAARFSVKVLVGVTLSFFSPVFSVVSVIPIPILGRVQRRFVATASRSPGSTGPEALEAANARQERLARGAGEQGCMYHI